MSSIHICYAKCWPCNLGYCPGGDHRWADEDDIAHAVKIGKPESSEGRCGCPCAKGPLLDEPEPLGQLVLDSIGGPPCPVCDADGACGYDSEGRAWIHAHWHDDAEDES